MVRLVFSRRSTSLIALALTGRYTNAFTSTVPTAFHRHHQSFSYRASSLRMSSTSDAKKKVLVPIADGSEEIETTCLTDTLVRFGADVSVASVMPELVCTMSRGIKVRPCAVQGTHPGLSGSKTVYIKSRINCTRWQ